MVNFDNTGFVIRIETGGNPIENWMATHDELVEMFQCLNEDMTTGKKYYHALELLRNLQPDFKTAKKMKE